MIPEKGRNALVIGGGYLGSRLADRLTACGYTVAVADKDPLHSSGQGWQVDVTQREQVRLLSENGMAAEMDTVFYCASTAGGSEDEFRRLYVQGLTHIRGFFPAARIIFCSSTVVYGETDGGLVVEDTGIQRQSGKCETLLEAERIVLEGGGTVARLSAIYGPGRCVLLERFLNSGKPVNGAPSRWVNYIHIDDAVSALVLLVESDRCKTSGHLYNISGTIPMQLIDIYSKLCILTGISIPDFEREQANPRRGFSNQRVCTRKLAALGWNPMYPSFLDGAKELLKTFGSQS